MFEVRNLNVAYGQSEVLHGIDLAVQPGEIVAVVGRNGMGKSTLMKSLIGTIPRRSGEVLIDGADVSTLPSHQRVARGLAYVPQGRQIFGTMTVRENIETGLVVTGKSEVPDEIYSLFPILWEFDKRRGGNLSGGQQQQLAIARALASDPKILLLDEPFGALDNQTRALMQEMLLGIWERDQKTVLFVTHDIEEAIFLGSRVIVMSARPGRIKAEINVDLPHPRSYKIKTTPEFVQLKERLVEEIRTEALKVAEHA